MKVVPGASRTRTLGVWNGALRVAVSAPAEGGKANAALVRYLAEMLGVSRSAVEVASGHGSPVKRVVVAGLGIEAARRRLEQNRAEQ